MPDQPPWYTEQQRAIARTVELAAERVLRGSVRRNGVVQTPRGSSYIADFEGSLVAQYAASINQTRPIHADFDSSFAYNVFLNSKYKHHHKCTTCLSVFRCGQAKCERTLCRICSAATEVTASWRIGYDTNEVVRLNFNGSSGSSWTHIGVDYQDAESRVLADLAPESNTEEES